MNEHLRQTGRTSRLVDKALQLSDQGRPVFIYTHDESYAKLVSDLVGRRGGGSTLIKVTRIPDDFDWRTMRPPRYHREYVFLVDHVAVEKELQRVDERILTLQQLARQLYPLTT